MNELTDFVARRSGLNRTQAEAAVLATLEYFTTRLPSPVVGRIHELLHGAPVAQDIVAAPAPIDT